MFGCLQSFSCIQFMRASKWTPLYFRRKKLSLQYCLKLSCNYNNSAYATIFNSKFHSVFERKPTQLPPCNPCFRWSASGWFQKEWCYYIFYTNHTTLAFNFTLHCSDKSNTPPEIFKHCFYELFVMSSRITIAYLPMALKKVTELLLLWSIETTLSVFDYLIQQASSELNYMPFCLR